MHVEFVAKVNETYAKSLTSLADAVAKAAILNHPAPITSIKAEIFLTEDVDARQHF